MFYGDTVDDFTGQGFLNGTVYDRAVQLLKDSAKWAEANGKKFYVVIAPNKNTVYPDYMPEGYTMASYRRYDQFVEMLTASGITAVDIRVAMANAVKATAVTNRAIPVKRIFYFLSIGEDQFSATARTILSNSSAGYLFLVLRIPMTCAGLL